jgi:hypothetical protein
MATAKKQLSKPKIGVPRVPIAAIRQEVHKQLAKEFELKFVTQSSGVTVDYSGTAYLITNIAQADTDTSREGDQIRARRVRVHGICVVGDSYNVMRVALVRWRPATTPTLAELFETTGSNIAPMSTMPQHDKRPSAIILKDKFLVLDTYHPTRKFHFDLNLDWKIQFVAGSATTQQDALYIVYISDSGAATHPSIVWEAKFEFIDI